MSSMSEKLSEPELLEQEVWEHTAAKTAAAVKMSDNFINTFFEVFAKLNIL